MHRSLPLLLALGALALPATAAAAPVNTVDYAVTIEGTADYNRADADVETAVQHDIGLTFKTTVPKMTFYGDVAEDSRGAMGTASVTRGSYVISGPQAQFRCRSHEITDATGGGFDATRGEGRTIFATRVIDAFDVSITGCDAGVPGWKLPFGSAHDEVGVGIFDGAFSIPDSRIGEANMTFPLKGEVTGTSCPFHHSLTVLCSLTWNATVTFKRIGEGVVDTEDFPLVPISPAPAPQPQPQPDDDLLVPLVPNPALENGLKLAKASLARDLASAGLPITCAARCSGTATATAGGRTVASRSFKADAGATRTIRLRFDAADRRAIRKAGAVKLALRAKVGDKTVRRAVTVRAPRRR
jgi:hypothetical protein